MAIVDQTNSIKKIHYVHWIFLRKPHLLQSTFQTGCNTARILANHLFHTKGIVTQKTINLGVSYRVQFMQQVLFRNCVDGTAGRGFVLPTSQRQVITSSAEKLCVEADGDVSIPKDLHLLSETTPS